MTNWKAIQVPAEKGDKKIRSVPHGIKPKYMAMGSWHADLSKDGVCRISLKSSWRSVK